MPNAKRSTAKERKCTDADVIFRLLILLAIRVKSSTPTHASMANKKKISSSFDSKNGRWQEERLKQSLLKVTPKRMKPTAFDIFPFCSLKQNVLEISNILIFYAVRVLKYLRENSWHILFPFLTGSEPTPHVSMGLKQKRLDICATCVSWSWGGDVIV